MAMISPQLNLMEQKVLTDPMTNKVRRKGVVNIAKVRNYSQKSIYNVVFNLSRTIINLARILKLRGIKQLIKDSQTNICQQMMGKTKSQKCTKLRQEAKRPKIDTEQNKLCKLILNRATKQRNQDNNRSYLNLLLALSGIAKQSLLEKCMIQILKKVGMKKA